jgi:uracil phosphoribosyltransferase
MYIHNFESENSILNQFIKELRDVSIQKDSMRFRKNIERIGEVLGYELSKTLSYASQTITTPLGSKNVALSTDTLVICSILRAGLAFHQGFLNYFDAAENGFISAYRHHENDADAFEVIVNYFAAPNLEGKILILADPMLATGRTLENVLKGLEKHGKPKQIHIVSVIGSEQGIQYIGDIFPENTHLWIAAVDKELNAKGYIVPGLGDAGDLSYGVKL